MNPNAKRLLEAFKKFVLLVAGIHLVIIIVYAVYYRDPVILNIFNIMDVDLFFPWIIEGFFSQAISLLAMVIVFGMIFAFFTKKEVTSS